MLPSLAVCLFDRCFSFAFNNGIRQDPDNQFDTANAVVIAGNWQIHQIGIAVGVD